MWWQNIWLYFRYNKQTNKQTKRCPYIISLTIDKETNSYIMWVIRNYKTIFCWGCCCFVELNWILMIKSNAIFVNKWSSGNVNLKPFRNYCTESSKHAKLLHGLTTFMYERIYRFNKKCITHLCFLLGRSRNRKLFYFFRFKHFFLCVLLEGKHRLNPRLILLICKQQSCTNSRK